MAYILSGMYVYFYYQNVFKEILLVEALSIFSPQANGVHVSISPSGHDRPKRRL